MSSARDVDAVQQSLGSVDPGSGRKVQLCGTLCNRLVSDGSTSLQTFRTRLSPVRRRAGSDGALVQQLKFQNK